MKLGTKLYLISMLLSVLFVLAATQAHSQDVHWWQLQARSEGLDQFNNPVTICHWICTSHGETRTTQGRFGLCSQPSAY